MLMQQMFCGCTIFVMGNIEGKNVSATTFLICDWALKVSTCISSPVGKGWEVGGRERRFSCSLRLLRFREAEGKLRTACPSSFIFPFTGFPARSKLLLSLQKSNKTTDHKNIEPHFFSLLFCGPTCSLNLKDHFS